MRRQLDAIKESNGLVGLNFEVSSVRADSHDEPDTLLTVLARQVDYLVERLDINRVAFGSDFDGTTMPRELCDVASLPHCDLCREERKREQARARMRAMRMRRLAMANR